jgi:hypothetical protein
MDSGVLRLFSCAALRPADPDGLCRLHAADALEGAFPNAAPKTSRELFDSILGVPSRPPPIAPRPPAWKRGGRMRRRSIEPVPPYDGQETEFEHLNYSDFTFPKSNFT